MNKTIRAYLNFAALFSLILTVGCKDFSLNKPIAELNGKPVMQSEYTDYLNQVPVENLQNFSTDTEKVKYVLKDSALEIVARQKDLHKTDEYRQRIRAAERTELTAMLWDALEKEGVITVTPAEIEAELARNAKDFTPKTILTYIVKEFPTKQLATQFALKEAKKRSTPEELLKAGASQNQIVLYTKFPALNGSILGLASLLRGSTLKVAACGTAHCFYVKTSETNIPARDFDFSRKVTQQRIKTEKRKKWMEDLYGNIKMEASKTSVK